MDVISIMCAQSAEDYFEKIESLAEDGNAAAQCGLGTMYINGTFVDKDEDKAMEWFLRASGQGSAEAASKLGIAYYCGIGTEIDYGEAFRWFSLASDRGHGPSDIYLAWMYANGQGTQRNAAGAMFHLFRALEAADSGDVSTQTHLGHIYMMENDVFGRDVEKASCYLTLAALQEDPDAQYSLGTLYADGSWERHSIHKARMWLGRAVSNGCKEAEHALATLGHGTPAKPRL